MNNIQMGRVNRAPTCAPQASRTLWRTQFRQDMRSWKAHATPLYVSTGPPARDVLIVASRMTTRRSGHSTSWNRSIARIADS